MNRSILKKTTGLMAVMVAIGFMAGCVPKTTENTTHLESGSLSVIRDEIYNDCLENKDAQGAQEVLDTHIYLTAFCCDPFTEVKYDDVKNRNYENIEYDIGLLQLAVAAYNEYNEESAMDIEVDWILHFNSCTKEQLEAIDAYVDWYHTAQNGNKERTIKTYTNDFYYAYEEIQSKYDISQAPRCDDLTPEQFREVQNYMKDASYQVDASLWE